MKGDDRRAPDATDDPMVDAPSFFSPKTHGFVRVAAATPEENPKPMMAAGQRTLKATRPAAIHDEVPR